MKTNAPSMIKAFAMSWMLVLSACGGGGGSGTGAETVATAQGLWNGSTSTSRSVTVMVLDDGTYWLLYSIPYVSAVSAGFVQGTSASLNGNFSSSDAIDFNLSGQSINPATVAASYVTKQSFNGSVSYANSNAPLTFTSSYNSAYDQTPNLTALAGNYLGIASVANSNDAVTLIISAQGVVAGTGATSQCQYGGLVQPRAVGNLYDVSLVIGGGACATNTVTGIGYFDAGSKRLYLAALNKSRTVAMSFTGVKP